MEIKIRLTAGILCAMTCLPCTAANFTVKDAPVSYNTVASFNFDDGMQGWEGQPTTKCYWETRRIAQEDDGKSFSKIDPADRSSLYLRATSSWGSREKTYVTSPLISIEDGTTLTFYAGFAESYDDACRLVLSVSTDGFNTQQTIWRSNQEKSDISWHWHPVTISLDGYGSGKVQFRFLYTSGSLDEDDLGGYAGDFAIDGFALSVAETIPGVEITAGESVKFTDITGGNIAERTWTFRGGDPETSDESEPTVTYNVAGKHDVSLTVRDRYGNTSTRTVTGFVTVKGKAPEARIIPPATFRLASNRLPLVAPHSKVTFRDGSEGSATLTTWTFRDKEDEREVLTSREHDAEVIFEQPGTYSATLVAQNDFGISSASFDFAVAYEGKITNRLPGDGEGTNYKYTDWGIFPGSNAAGITAYGERFSAPSRPLRINGVDVAFSMKDLADLNDGMRSIGVHLYTATEGKPDRKVASSYKYLSEIEVSVSDKPEMTYFPFEQLPFVDDEFFVVVDGLPSLSLDDGEGLQGTMVALAASPFREDGNTAYVLKDYDWMEARLAVPSTINHTSYLIEPHAIHSVMMPETNESGEIRVGAKGGVAEFEIFSFISWHENPDIDCDWLEVVSKPEFYPLQTVRIAYDDAPEDVAQRTGHINLTDGASNLVLTVIQTGNAGIEDVTGEGFGAYTEGNELVLKGLSPTVPVSLYDLTGIKRMEMISDTAIAVMDISPLPAGVYLIRHRGKTLKIAK